jgi:hypothetical protein
VKALSIRQPWLWAILDIPEDACPKRVENRKGTAFNYRGPVLLHASSGGTRREFEDATVSILVARADHGHTSPAHPHPISPRFPTGFDRSKMERGCFLGIARIVDVVMHPPAFVRGALTSGYRIAGQLGLKLADVRKLPPVTAPGSLGLYNVEHRPRRYLLAEEDGYVRTPKPGFVDFGEHRDAYAAAWAELAAKGAR